MSVRLELPNGDPPYESDGKIVIPPRKARVCLTLSNVDSRCVCREFQQGDTLPLKSVSSGFYTYDISHIRTRSFFDRVEFNGAPLVAGTRLLYLDDEILLGWETDGECMRLSKPNAEIQDGLEVYVPYTYPTEVDASNYTSELVVTAVGERNILEANCDRTVYSGGISKYGSNGRFSWVLPEKVWTNKNGSAPKGFHLDLEIKYEKSANRLVVSEVYPSVRKPARVTVRLQGVPRPQASDELCNWTY